MSSLPRGNFGSCSTPRETFTLLKPCAAAAANSFMGNLQGNTRPVIRNNIFGGTVGGPLILPKIYSGRDRTFFNFGYQGTRQRQYNQAVSTVPTAALRDGNF